MELAILIVLLCLEPILSTQNLTWEDYQIVFSLVRLNFFCQRHQLFYILHIMRVAILIYLVFLEPILSQHNNHRKTNNLSWEEYRKAYYTEKLTPAEETRRKKIYLENLAKIQEHNDKFRKGLVSYSLQLNEYTHLTDEEFEDINSSLYPETNVKVSRSDGFYHAPKNATIPEAVNWVYQGAVTGIKAQNRCGSCYAFGVAGVLESHYYIKYNKLIQFSEQQIVDCGKSHGLEGCKGGTLEKAFNYAQDVGLTDQEGYPYEAATGPCRLENLPIYAKLKATQFINNFAIRDMEAAIAFTGPVVASFLSIPIRAMGPGIFSGDTCTDRKLKNHAVVVVGYNTSVVDGRKYWIIKNNWGTLWGDNGFFYVDRRPDDPCGLTVGAYVVYIE